MVSKEFNYKKVNKGSKIIDRFKQSDGYLLFKWHVENKIL